MAGELVEQDFHLELRGYLHGPGTAIDYGADGWGGLSTVVVKTSDFTLEQADGDYPGRDYLASKLLTFPLVWGGGTPAEAMDTLADLTDVWGPERDTELELHAQLPGWGHFFVIGRPRGLVEDLRNLKSGELAAIATFAALDPTVYFPGSGGS